MFKRLYLLLLFAWFIIPHEIGFAYKTEIQIEIDPTELLKIDSIRNKAILNFGHYTKEIYNGLNDTTMSYEMFNRVLQFK